MFKKQPTKSMMVLTKELKTTGLDSDQAKNFVSCNEN